MGLRQPSVDGEAVAVGFQCAGKVALRPPARHRPGCMDADDRAEAAYCPDPRAQAALRWRGCPDRISARRRDRPAPPARRQFCCAKSGDSRCQMSLPGFGSRQPLDDGKAVAGRTGARPVRSPCATCTSPTFSYDYESCARQSVLPGLPASKSGIDLPGLAGGGKRARRIANRQQRRLLFWRSAAGLAAPKVGRNLAGLDELLLQGTRPVENVFDETGAKFPSCHGTAAPGRTRDCWRFWWRRRACLRRACAAGPQSVAA